MHLIATKHMKLIVTNKAADWFKEEIGFSQGAGVRFKTKIYGSSPFDNGFGIAIDSVQPEDPLVTYQAPNGVLFFIEQDDEWFFDEYDLEVTLDERLCEPTYNYIKNGHSIH
ncbi:HesB/YadR/YfhF family protein [Facklamia sp. P12950]|uniref:HesB/YadR/YfhF family protein n=1 Tax=Facklamia sp. P12950 TaxID=3421951 RepID=UPI003D185B8D